LERRSLYRNLYRDIVEREILQRGRVMAEQTDQFIDKFTEILHKNGALKGADAQALKRAFRRRLDIAYEEFLIDENIINREELLQALSEYYNLPSIDVEGEFFSHHLVTMFPKDLLLRHHFIPYDQDENILIVVAAEPDDPGLPEMIGNYVSYDVTFMVGYFRDIEEAIEEFYDRALTEDIYDEDIREEQQERQLEEEMEKLE
jgi:hypothetical protein